MSGQDMLKIENNIEIETPIDHVWSVLVDRERYAEWNPVIYSQDGTLQRGCKSNMRINPGLFPMNVSIIYRHVKENQELSWFGGPPLVKGFHYFRLEKLDNGNTKVIHGEEFGPLAAFLSWLPIITIVKNKYKKADRALKARCESLHSLLNISEQSKGDNKKKLTKQKTKKKQEA